MGSRNEYYETIHPVRFANREAEQSHNGAMPAPDLKLESLGQKTGFMRGGRCDRSERFRQLGGMSTAMGTEVSVRQNRRGDAFAEFEEIYRSNVGLVAAYFARRCWEPQ